MTDLSTLTPGTWSVDPAHSSVGFVVRHLMISKVRGRFGEFSGTIEVTPDPLSSTVHAEVALASVATGDAGRDEHLRSGDFFDVERWPTMAFTSTTVKEEDGAHRLVGDLSLHGVTREVVFDLEFDGVGTDPWGNEKAGFSATAEIDRREFGLEWNAALETGGVLVGEKVRVELDIQAVHR